MKTITINIDSDNRPIIEGLTHYPNSLLQAQYDHCFGAMESILVAQKSEVEYSKAIASDIEYSNNIIVFDGDRGSGKTSCMLSVVNMLFGDGEKPYALYKYLPEVEWQKLPMLEPAFFDNERNVLSLIVSRLYDEFIKFKKDNSEDDKRNILSQFVKIQKELKYMFKETEKQDALEYLVNLSSSVSLRKDLHDLISAYLRYKNPKATKLLILIDDIDLNQKAAISMVEEIRKYLVLDNCLVMVSVKIDQLSKILYNEYLWEYKEVDDEIRGIVNQRVERYLSKLFPQRHRIHMPQPKEYLHHELVIESSRSFDYNIVPGTTVEEAIPDLIYAKTRFLFYNTRKATSYIVPRNLRNIRQLLKLLMEMKNYQDGDHDNATAINKEVFKHYLFNDWVEQNLPSEYAEFARQLAQRNRYSAVNYLVHEYLTKLAPDAESVYTTKANVAINHQNVSLGDIFSDLRRVETYNHGFYIPELLFFLKAFYSIRLYEAYDGITPDVIEGEQKKIKYLIVRKENDALTDNYQALVAGSLFNSEVENFRMSTDLANLKIPQDKIKALIDKAISETDQDKKKQMLRLVEFLMLFVSYKGSALMNGDYRTYPSLFYKDFAIDSDTDYIATIGSLIYNLSRYDECLNRFRRCKEFAPFFANYDYSLEAGSLYNELKALALRQRAYRGNRKSDESKLRSICCFRNMEVLEDFYESVKEWQYNPEAKTSELLATFFNEASKYSIYTYDRDKGEGVMEPYTISFGYFSIFAELLATETAKEELEELLKADKKTETGTQDNANNGDTTGPKSENMPSAADLPTQTR